MKAVNTKGQSNYSNEIPVTTKVDTIPAPEQVTFEPSTRTVAFSVGPSCLSLVGVAEALVPGRNSVATWQVVDQVTLTLSGSAPTFQEATIDFPQVRTMPIIFYFLLHRYIMALFIKISLVSNSYFVKK